MLTAGEYDWIVVVGNLGKARKSWGRLSCVLGWDGEELNVSGKFYNAVAQAVLLFGEETWVLTQKMEKDLDRFQSRFVRRLTGKQPRQRTYGSWDCPPLAEALGEAGLEWISDSVLDSYEEQEF